MSDIHITELRLKLEAKNWIVIAETEGNDHNISAVWTVARPDGTETRHLEFDGLDLNGLGCLPLLESSGCSVVEAPNLSLYFSRKNRSWDDDLSQFIDDFNKL